MQYTAIELDEIKLVGKTFEFATKEIKTVDYQMFYKEVCSNMSPEISFGIYEVNKDITKFTIAIKTNKENDYNEVIIRKGNYLEFEVDYMNNQSLNQYVKCIKQLEDDNISFDANYLIEVMDQNFDPMNGKTIYKCYLKNTN